MKQDTYVLRICDAAKENIMLMRQIFGFQTNTYGIFSLIDVIHVCSYSM